MSHVRRAQFQIIAVMLKRPGFRQTVIRALACQLQSLESEGHPGTLLKEIEPIVRWRSQVMARWRRKPTIDIEAEVVRLGS
jgi:hypothetical protein